MLLKMSIFFYVSELRPLNFQFFISLEFLVNNYEKLTCPSCGNTFLLYCFNNQNKKKGSKWLRDSEFRFNCKTLFHLIREYIINIKCILKQELLKILIFNWNFLLKFKISPPLPMLKPRICLNKEFFRQPINLRFYASF